MHILSEAFLDSVCADEVAQRCWLACSLETDLLRRSGTWRHTKFVFVDISFPPMPQRLQVEQWLTAQAACCRPTTNGLLNEAQKQQPARKTIRLSAAPKTQLSSAKWAQKRAQPGTAQGPSPPQEVSGCSSHVGRLGSMPEMCRTSPTALIVICALALSVTVGWLLRAWKAATVCMSWSAPLPQAWEGDRCTVCIVQVPLLISKVHREVLSWSYSEVIAGRHQGGDLVKVPTRFNGLQHYCGVFKELLLAELQASLLQVTQHTYRTSTHSQVPTAGIGLIAAWVHSAVFKAEAPCKCMCYSCKGLHVSDFCQATNQVQAPC